MNVCAASPAALVQGLPYWGDLTQNQQERVRAAALLRTYPRGQSIYGLDQECLGMTQVQAGQTRTFLLSPEGREITLFRLVPGDACVLSASCVIRQITFETQMTAETDTALLVIPSSLFAQLAEENLAVKCFLYQLATERFSQVMWAMQEMLFKGYDQRLAAFLVEEYDRTGQPVLAMTHEQIAKNTSSAREVVARMLARFAADGLVEQHRGSVRLIDVPGLRRLNPDRIFP